MKKNIWSGRVSAATLAILTTLSLPAMAQNISVTVDGDVVGFTGQPPVQRFGTVLVPLRGVFEKLGATVMYDSPTRTIMANRGGTTVSLKIGDTQATVNGQPQTLALAAQEVNGTTLVPLRFVSEALGAQVQWNDANRTVIISTAGLAEAPPPPIPSGESLIRELTVSPDDKELEPGDVITVRLKAIPGGVARFNIGGVVRNIAMREESAGNYRGRYTVRKGDSLTQAPIRATFSLNGRTETETAAAPITIAAGVPDMPVILSPAAGRAVGDAVTIRGKAIPGTTVRYHVKYRGTVLGQATHGTVTDGEVNVDDRGNWRLEDLPVSAPQGVRNLIYTLEVQSVGAAGGVSETASVEFRK